MVRDPAGGWWVGAELNKEAPTNLFMSHYRKMTSPNVVQIKMDQLKIKFSFFQPFGLIWHKT